MRWVIYYYFTGINKILTKEFTTSKEALEEWERMMDAPNLKPFSLIKEEIIRVANTRR